MKTIQRHAPLALAMALAAAVPATAQNTVDNAASDVANAASGIGNGVSNGVDAIGSSVDNAVDVNLTTGNALAGTDANLNADVNLGATDLNAVDGAAFNESETVTTTETTTVPEESSGKGAWGLLGLAGLLSFLFRPKKPAIHLDERTRTGAR